MKLKVLLMSFYVFAVALAQGKNLVNVEIKIPRARCIKFDKDGSCLMYSVNSSYNIRYSLMIKPAGPIKQGNYTLLVLASHVGFMDPYQISLIKNVNHDDLKKGLSIEGSIDTKRLPIVNCADFGGRILLTPFVLSKNLTQKEVENMLSLSRYCPDPKDKSACSYSAFFAYVQKTNMVLNAVRHEFVTICKGE